jgi:hypothetical protein
METEACTLPQLQHAINKSNVSLAPKNLHSLFYIKGHVVAMCYTNFVTISQYVVITQEKVTYSV